MFEGWRTPLSDTSLTASDLGTPGELRFDPGTGNMYKLFRATATLSAGAPVQYHSGSGVTDGYTVQAAPQQNLRANGVYNGQSVSIAASAYFWGQVRGVGPVLNGAATLASNTPARGSTAGLVSVPTNASAAIAFRTIGSLAAAASGNCHIFCDW